MKDVTPIIDWSILAKAQKYYADLGFVEKPVPWIINFESYSATKPNDREDFYALGGYLNASAEQSFIELMLNGEKLGKNCAISPCFRAEPTLDEIHHLYFVKLELIEMEPDKTKLEAMIEVAKNFYDGELPYGLKTKVIPMEEPLGSFDIVDPIFGVELGSYGVRKYKEYSWVYGTGVALPRLQTAINKIKEKIDV